MDEETFQRLAADVGKLQNDIEVLRFQLAELSILTAGLDVTLPEAER